jgi:hypothetical protein
MSQIIGTSGKFLNNLDLVATVISPTTYTVPVDTNGYTYIAGTGVVFSAENSVGDAKYTRIYLNVTAYMHQFVFKLSPAQLADPVKGTAQFQLQGMVMWTKPAARIKG